VAVSGTAYDQLQGRFDGPLEFVGEQHVKNISRPVRVYRLRLDGKPARRSLPKARPRVAAAAAVAVAAVLVAAAIAWQFWPEPSASAKPSVAVLPFSNYGGDEATGRLADGLTEDIITDLAQHPELEVVSRSSTETFKDKPADARQVGAALNVGYVVEGSIQREEGRIRITAQLIDAQSGNHPWSERWDRPDEDVFTVQTEIAQQVANRLGGGAGLIQQSARDVARRKRPDKLTAYELYLLGTERLEQMTRADNAEAIRLLTRAVELDPNLARAWIELSHAHMVSSWNFAEDPGAEQEAALAAAERAVQLDPNDAEAYAALGGVLAARGEFARGKAAFETALRISPGSAEILTFFSGWASSFGEPERGAAAADQAIRLNPNYPSWASALFAYAYFMAGRDQDALHTLDGQSPDSYTREGWIIRAATLAATDQSDEARAALEEALEHYPDLTVEGMANAPGYSAAEHQRFIESMRLAGFPSCARPEALAAIDRPARLPDCTAEDEVPAVDP
jgi:TolB-like protein/Tfp pilus assembly protein PilF